MEVAEGMASIGDVDAFLDRLDRIAAAHDTTVQAFDARCIVDREHLARAVELATRAAERERMIARELRVEILLYAAGRRQINRAVELGVSEGECPVAVVVHGVTDSANEADAATAVTNLVEPAETLGAFGEGHIRDYFDVSDRELAATDADLSVLVTERVALLSVEK